MHKRGTTGGNSLHPTQDGMERNDDEKPTSTVGTIAGRHAVEKTVIPENVQQLGCIHVLSIFHSTAPVFHSNKLFFVGFANFFLAIQSYCSSNGMQ